MTTYRESKTLKYVDSIGNKLRKFPPSLHIAVTDHCFNHCPMCGHWHREKKASLPFKDLRRFLVEPIALGLQTICYTGGDPMAYPEINTLLEYHNLGAGYGIDFGIVTAGFVPHTVHIDYLYKAKWVRVSLDAIGEERYKVCRGGVSFNAVDDSIKRMLNYDVNVELGVTVHKDNINHIGEIYEYAEKLGIEKFEVRTAYRHSDEMLSPIQKQFHPKPVQACYASLFQLFIDAYGFVYPCCIMAGDTEAEPRMRHIAHISEGAGKVQKCAEAFSTIGFRKVSDVCNQICIPRLNSINVIMGRKQGRDFF